VHLALVIADMTVGCNKVKYSDWNIRDEET
jgi:hypothetical protein